GRELTADAADRQGIHRASVFWQSANDGGSATPGTGGEPQTGAAPDAAHETGGDLSETANNGAWRWPQDLPVPAAKPGNQAAKPGVERGHHLCAATSRFPVSGGDPGLVQPLCADVEVVEQPGRGVLRGGPGRSPGGGPAGDFQHGPGGAVYGASIHGTADVGRRGHQHGWQRAGSGQRVRGAPVAVGEVRGGLPQGLRGGGRL